MLDFGNNDQVLRTPEAVEIDWDAELRKHARWLRAVVFARVGEPQAVEEVMQEVALQAVRQKAPIQDPTKVAQWLYRLAVLQSLLYRRRQGRRRKLLERYRQSRDDSAGAPGDPLEWLLRGERMRLVREALARLPSRDAEVLLMKYAEDLSYEEIAERLGISFSAAQARLHRARNRLRGEMEARIGSPAAARRSRDSS
ncbi:MAG: RNA polymerase sigma factor [Thermogutta sp.]|nr:RNA polymerase sigma factor [Thermogutta sp.]